MLGWSPGSWALRRPRPAKTDIRTEWRVARALGPEGLPGAGVPWCSPVHLSPHSATAGCETKAAVRGTPAPRPPVTCFTPLSSLDPGAVFQKLSGASGVRDSPPHLRWLTSQSKNYSYRTRQVSLFQSVHIVVYSNTKCSLPPQVRNSLTFPRQWAF